MRLDWSGVLEIVEVLLDILYHGDVQYAVLLVPVQCNSAINTPFPILCCIIFVLECIYEMLGVLFYLVFYVKVVDH